MHAVFRLLPYAYRHWRGLVAVFATMGVTVCLEVLKPWPTKILVDHILGQQPAPEWLPGATGPNGLNAMLLWVCGGTVGIFLLASLAGMVNTLAAITFGQRTVYDLAADLFRHLQKLSLLFHVRRPIGES